MAFFRSRDHEERIRKLETAQKELAMEWELAYEKLLKLMGRIAKRTAEQVPLEPDSDVEQAAPAGDGSGPTFHRVLTPRQRALQSRILRRRQLTEGRT